MNYVKFAANKTEGQFLVRSVPIDNLPRGINTMDTVDSTIEILLVIEDQKTPGTKVAVFYDHDDFKELFKCSLFELHAQLRSWLGMLGIPDGQWMRFDIAVPEPTTAT